MFLDLETEVGAVFRPQVSLVCSKSKEKLLGELSIQEGSRVTLEYSCL